MVLVVQLEGGETEEKVEGGKEEEEDKRGEAEVGGESEEEEEVDALPYQVSVPAWRLANEGYAATSTRSLSIRMNERHVEEDTGGEDEERVGEDFAPDALEDAEGRRERPAGLLEGRGGILRVSGCVDGRKEEEEAGTAELSEKS